MKPCARRRRRPSALPIRLGPLRSLSRPRLTLPEFPLVASGEVREMVKGRRPVRCGSWWRGRRCRRWRGGSAERRWWPHFRFYVVKQRRPPWSGSGGWRVGAVLPEQGVTYYDVPRSMAYASIRYTHHDGRTGVGRTSHTPHRRDRRITNTGRLRNSMLRFNHQFKGKAQLGVKIRHRTWCATTPIPKKRWLSRPTSLRSAPGHVPRSRPAPDCLPQKRPLVRPWTPASPEASKSSCHPKACQFSNS